MGLCSSAPAAPDGGAAGGGGGGGGGGKVKPVKQKSAFDQRIVAALKRFKASEADRAKKDRVASFNQVIMRFARIRTAIKHIEGVFKRFDADESGFIDYEELTQALQVLGSNVSRTEVATVFHESDIYDNGKLSLKEFVLCLVLGYVLGDLKLNETAEAQKTTDEVRKSASQYFGHAQELESAFNIVVGTYLLFDEDASGDLDREEVLRQMAAGEGVFASASAASFLSDARWKELDWDGDGQITFREFIWAFQTWIADEVDEDDEASA